MKSIVRTYHNKEKPYFQICRKSVNDENLDNATLGLWVRCLSNSDDWEFRVEELAVRCKTTPYQIYKQLNKLIAHGYCERTYQYKIGPSNKQVRSCTVYTIYEEKQVKKSFLLCENEEVGNQNLGNCDALINTNTNKDKENNIIGRNSVHNSTPPPSEASRVANAPLSASASEICDYFLSKIKEKKPDFKLPKKEKWVAEFDKMLRIDKRDLTKTKLIIDWIVNGKSFLYIQSPKALREKYDQQELFFNADAEEQKKEPNKRFFYETKAKAPERFKSIKVKSYGIVDERTGKDAGWELPKKTFGEILAKMVGGTFTG